MNTYFEIAGCLPGVYSGIQQSGRGRLAIFSLWDADDGFGDGSDKAKVVSHNKAKGVRISGFGGEGTGGKTIMDYNWKIGKTYKMVVKARLKNGVWKVRNKLHGNGQSFQMAVLSRKQTVCTMNSFYAFIEDWGDEGCAIKREAEYFNPKISIDGQSVPVSGVTFIAWTDKPGTGAEVWFQIINHSS